MAQNHLLLVGTLTLAVLAPPSAQQFKSHHKNIDSVGDLEQQNRITQEILAQYLQKRLFPHQRRIPSPFSTPNRRTNDDDDDHPNPQQQEEEEDDEDERLQRGESEKISKFYFSSKAAMKPRPALVLLALALHSAGGHFFPASAASTQTISSALKGDCANCVDEGGLSTNRWTMPLLKLGEKRYYLGIFFKANWYRAAQYCRYHGMHLASISSQEENDRLEKHIKDFGLGNEHFWTSGTDQAEEGSFFWMSTGRPLTFTNWNTGEPNNFVYENGEEEHCLELWNRDGKGLKWNDTPCSFETFFVCEVQ